MLIYSIYKITNKINQKVYIGYTENINKRIQEHKNSSKSKNNKFYKAIRKYGWDNFYFEIIYQSPDSEHCLNVMENYFITQYDSFTNGYNSTLGGEGSSGTKCKKIKKKMSISRNHRFIAKDSSGKTYQIRNDDPRFLSGELVGINKGISPSKETLDKLSKARVGNKNRLGHKHSDDIKKIIAERTSAALKGKPRKTIACPHCGKIGGAGNMKRYHFTNCKNY